MDEIKIIYIDDELDTNISKYMHKEYKINEKKKIYKEIWFDCEKGYENLINNEDIKQANIILIDSRLFENNKVSSGKFSGEEFKMILKKVFPFIEVIVITQNELEDQYGTISKFKGKIYSDATKYYKEKLKSVLDNAVKNVEIYRNIANKLKINDGIDKFLIEKILNSLEGTAEYDELNKKDIDDIIQTFKEIERDINGK